jgi:hypothetical protein
MEMDRYQHFQQKVRGSDFKLDARADEGAAAGLSSVNSLRTDPSLAGRDQLFLTQVHEGEVKGGYEELGLGHADRRVHELIASAEEAVQGEHVEATEQ